MIPLLIALTGCTSECTGPGCADSYTTSRLIVIDDGALDSQTGVLTIEDRVNGDRVDGVDWSVQGFGGRLYIGMPDRSTVTVIDVPKGDQEVDDVSRLRIEMPANEGFGRSIALADTDGDGRTELWVGAPGAEGGAGAVYRFPDLDALGSEAWDLRLTSLTPGDGLGERITGCSDVTGDAADEVVITAPAFREPIVGSWEPVEGGIPELSGAVWLLPSETLKNRPDVQHPWELGPTLWGADAGAGAGRSAVCDQDLTGDGIADLALGVPFAGPDDAGRVFVIPAADALPNAGPLSDVRPFTLRPDPQDSGWFGAALATRVDEDGVELVVGASGWQSGSGRVSVYRTPLPQQAGRAEVDAVFVAPRDEPDHFGHTLATGDYDGDGEQELFVGAPRWRATGQGRTRYDTGRAWIWTGSSRIRWNLDGDFDAEHEIRGNQPFLRIGTGAVFADVDGDGIDELLQPVRAPIR